MANTITENLHIWTAALLGRANGARGTNGKHDGYGITKLRELILGAALRGSFEKQHESLPERIERDMLEAKRQYYESSGSRPKEYLFGAALLREFVLPDGWAWRRVGELCDLQTGATPSTQKPEYFDGDIRWLVSGDVNQGIIEDCEGRISEEGLASSNCKVLPPKTVLIALNGQGKTRASVALLNVAAACNQSLVGIIPFSASILDPMFLLLALKYRYYEIRDVTGQKQRRGLNMGLVAQLSIPLPPISSQRRIVAKVAELMAVCDQLEQGQTKSINVHKALVETLLDTLNGAKSQSELNEAWARVDNNFDTLFTTDQSVDQLRMTILQLAVTGRLVCQDPNDESAEALYEKEIELPRGYLRSNKQSIKGVSPISVAALPLIPKTWTYRSVDELYQTNHILDYADGNHGNLYPRKEDFGAEGVLFLTAAQIDSAGVINWQECPRLSREKAEQLTKGWSREGDVLFTHNATVGRTAIANSCPEKEFLLGTSVTFYRINADAIDHGYLYLYFSSGSWYSQAAAVMQQTTRDQVSITKQALFYIALPPLREQQRIVDAVFQLLSLIEQLKCCVKKTQATLIHLADAVVEQAVA